MLCMLYTKRHRPGNHTAAVLLCPNKSSLCLNVVTRRETHYSHKSWRQHTGSISKVVLVSWCFMRPLRKDDKADCLLFHFDTRLWHFMCMALELSRYCHNNDRNDCVQLYYNEYAGGGVWVSCEHTGFILFKYQSWKEKKVTSTLATE